MEKYYTRACNFYYGLNSIEKIKKKKTLPLCGNKLVYFDTIEIISRKSKKKIYLHEIKKQKKNIREKINFDLKKITKKKFFSQLKFNGMKS